MLPRKRVVGPAGRGPAAVLGVAICAVLLMPAAVRAQSWTDWTDRTLSVGMTNGTATGTLTLGPDVIGVSYTGDVAPQTQTGCGVSYWASNSVIYTRPDLGLPNPPLPCDQVALVGGTARPLVQTLTFSQPVVDPVLAILSLGQPSQIRTYQFDRDFELLRSGSGHWGGNPAGSLFDDGFNGTAWVLRGIEGHGLIRFSGPVTSISWTVPLAESWHSITVGAAASVSNIPEPGTVALLAGGLLAMGGVMARRRRA